MIGKIYKNKKTGQYSMSIHKKDGDAMKIIDKQEVVYNIEDFNIKKEDTNSKDKVENGI